MLQVDVPFYEHLDLADGGRDGSDQRDDDWAEEDAGGMQRSGHSGLENGAEIYGGWAGSQRLCGAGDPGAFPDE
jgi:hypothetical protein